jgi:hypothetical protein
MPASPSNLIRRPTIPAVNHQKVQDWLRIRRVLLDMEAAFTDLAVRVATGQGDEHELQERRHELEGMRELCSAAYRQAFPDLQEQP